MGPDDRSPVLIQRRNLKMARSAHAFVRGSTIRFYEWLESSEARVAPEGPPIWICGDCHVGNLGPVANAKGKIAIQIRDLDQTVIGNPAHDLIRLGLSLAMAARGAADDVGEQLIDLMGLVMTPEREDGTTAGTTRVGGCHPRPHPWGCRGAVRA